MSKTSARNEPTGYPEFAVKYETLRRFFDPPLASSTFHDFVNKGKITPLPGVRGFYKLNDSLRRLGLREVRELPQEIPARTTEDVIRLAFHIIDPGLFPAPTWLSEEEAITGANLNHAELIVAQHSANVAELDHYHLKTHYLQGVINMAVIMEKERQPRVE